MDPRIQHADGFVHVPSDGEEIHKLVTHNAFLVDEEQTAVRDHFSFGGQVAFFVVVVLPSQHVVVGGDGLVGVCNEGVRHAFDAALVLGHAEVRLVGLCGVGGHTHHRAVARVKFTELLLEGVDFSGADEGEVLGVEEQDHVLVAEVLVKREVVDNVLSIDNCGFAEVGGLAADENCHGS